MDLPSRDMDSKDSSEAPSRNENHVSLQTQGSSTSSEEEDKPSPDENNASLQKQYSSTSSEEEEKPSSSRLEESSMAVKGQGAPIREAESVEASSISTPAMIPPASPPRSEPVPIRQFSRTFSSWQMSDEEFRNRFVIPAHLREAMAIAVESQQTDSRPIKVPRGVTAPSHPIIVMINSKSGGRKGPALRDVLHDLLSVEQVYDLSATPPQSFFRYGLACLEKLAESGDQCAKETRNNIRVIVAGGDGTVGWVLGSLAELHVEQRTPVPSVGIIPLGTGNDLARSFGWGGSFMFAARWNVKRYLLKAGGSATCKLDSWQVVVKTSSTVQVAFPHAVHPQEHTPPTVEDDDSQSSSDDNMASFEGVFYNYFSIGMDAQVAYGFHHMREKAPHLAMGPISNKLIYSGYSCTQGWFCTPCSANPRARGLRNVMRLYVKRSSSDDWEPVDVPENVRAVVMLNLQSYASGRNPWGHPSHEYNVEKHFVEPKPDDGILEVFGLFDGWHASLVMLNLCSAKRLTQGIALRLELVGDKRLRAYMQMDGEPWRQPLLQSKNATVIHITPVPTHSVMLKGI